MKLLANMQTLLSRAPRQVPPAVRTADSRSARAGENLTGGLSPEAFETHLEWVMAGSKQLLPNRLILIKATGVADAFGERWASARERAETIGQQTLERHLSLPEDAYVRIAPLSYLVLFAKTPQTTAAATAARVATELADQLLGSSWTSEMVSVLSIFGRLPDQLECRHIPIESPGKSNLLDMIMKSAAAGERAALANADMTRGPFDDTLVVYRPMWDVQLGVMSTYLAVPARKGERGDILAGRHEVLGGADAEAAAKLDIALVGKVAADLDAAAKAGRKFLVGIPVHFDTLAARTMRGEFIAACDAIPPALRRLVLFELVDIPVGVPAGRLREISSLLKGRARAVIACVPIHTQEFSPFSDAGVLSIGTDVSQDGASERVVIAQMHRFVTAAEKAKTHAFVHGLRSISLTSSAVAAGFRYVDGNSVRSLVDAPQELKRYSAGDLYLKLLEGRE